SGRPVRRDGDERLGSRKRQTGANPRAKEQERQRFHNSRRSEVTAQRFGRSPDSRPPPVSVHPWGVRPRRSGGGRPPGGGPDGNRSGAGFSQEARSPAF